MSQLLFNDALLKMEVSNFSLMTICACGIVMLSVYFAEEYIRKPSKLSPKLTENIIRLPDILQPVVSAFIEKKTEIKIYKKQPKQGYLLFFTYNVLYFLAMFATVVVMKRYPMLLLCIQHIAIVIVIGFYFLQFARPTIAIPCSCIYSLIWFLSVNTSYRWLINNTIVVMCVLLTGYVQFRNFLYLQIFMWLAFVYDVYMLGGLNISSTFQFFSYTTDKPIVDFVSVSDVQQVVTESCQNLLCSIFSHDKSFKIPTVFSVQFGNPIDYVYIGSGDIMIGALVANFSLTFFKKIKYLLFTVLCFGVSVALLSQVTHTPFPALLSIVPICSIGIIISGLFSRRWFELIVDRDHHSKSNVIAHESIEYLEV